jgi:hypothetical protein
MPLGRINHPAGKPAAFRVAISRGVYQAMLDAFQSARGQKGKLVVRQRHRAIRDIADAPFAALCACRQIQF